MKSVIYFLNGVYSAVRYWNIYREAWETAGIRPSLIEKNENGNIIIRFKHGNFECSCSKKNGLSLKIDQQSGEVYCSTLDNTGWAVFGWDNDNSEDANKFVRRSVLISKHLKKLKFMTKRQAICYCADAVMILEDHADERIFEVDLENAVIHTSFLNVF